MIGALDPGYERVRTTIASMYDPPIAVAFTSALARDGRTDLAIGTARAFARAGFATLLLDATPRRAAVATRLDLTLPAATVLDAAQLTVIATRDKNLAAASIANDALLEAATPATLRAFIAALRARFAVVLVDAPEAFHGATVAPLAAACDGVVLAVRYGRRPGDDDARLVPALESAGGRIIGSVSTCVPNETQFIAR
jgi:non-specific protein-tyrosine kinase